MTDDALRWIAEVQKRQMAINFIKGRLVGVVPITPAEHAAYNGRLDGYTSVGGTEVRFGGRASEGYHVRMTRAPRCGGDAPTAAPPK